MSQINIEVTTITALLPHPNADRLEVAQVLGAECCVPKGKHQVGDTVLWFPPGLLIPTPVGTALGVIQYLKPSQYPGDSVQAATRVAACRLRGVPSYGFVISKSEAQAAAVLTDIAPAGMTVALSVDDLKPGDNVDAYFRAVKYEPPARGMGCPRAHGFNADAESPNENFHKYTDIQHWYKYANVIPEGEPVRITEKLHGSNARMGLVKDGEDFVFIAGSNNVQWKPVMQNGEIPIWWRMMSPEVVGLLTELCDEKNNVIIFGELFGPGIQDLDYGVAEPQLRIFDISVNGHWMNWQDVWVKCLNFDLVTVPLLYEGPFSVAKLKECTFGATTVSMRESIKSKFKDREGCVVTPLTERYQHGRVCFKSVSADYLDRKNPQDN